MKKLAIFLGVVIFTLLGILLFVKPAKSPTTGNSPILAEAISPDGRLHVVLPRVDDVVISPLVASGTVTGGGWFFEASFPIKVLDADGRVLGKGVVKAGGDWMSAGEVPFSANITFTKPKYATGTVVFSRDNPSGDPKNAEELHVPVRFQ
jgi:hypothetical protein